MRVAEFILEIEELLLLQENMKRGDSTMQGRKDISQRICPNYGDRVFLTLVYLAGHEDR